MHRRTMPNNYRVLRNILSKTRQIDVSQDMSYVLIYAFLYKYASDLLKNHLSSVIEDEPITLDEAFKNEEFTVCAEGAYSVHAFADAGEPNDVLFGIAAYFEQSPKTVIAYRHVARLPV